MKEFPRRFLSLRDKNGSHRRSKSVPPGDKSRPLHSDNFLGLNHSKRRPKEDDERYTEKNKINKVQRRLDELNITNVGIDHIRAIMSTQYADFDPEKTAEFIDMEQKAASGIVPSYDPSVHMVGAENRSAVTCYIDSLLFAMFAKVDAFECMLKNDFPSDDPRSKLVRLLRLWVIMLRSGKLIYTDMTKVVQDAMADCGWSDARMLEQQDTSEAFAFLTETLQLPLLSLQVDLFHQGRGDKDDHKVVYERLLNLAVPPDPEGKGIQLEDCLEEYFNTQVDVLRENEETKKSIAEDGTPDSKPTLVHRNTIRLTDQDNGEASTVMSASPVTVSPPARSSNPTSPTRDEPPVPHRTQSETAVSFPEDIPSTSEGRPSTRTRSTSIIQSMLLDEKGRSSSIDGTMLQKAKRKGSVVVKTVTIPAWQFFRLIPWNAVTTNEPQSNNDVALNFDQRPVVGICLKRYAMTEQGVPKRLNTYIDIPDGLRLPHFMLADEKLEEDPEKLSMEYKLVLQSVVCHRGDSLQSGHYIAFARVAPKLLTGNRQHDFDPPPDYEEAQWVQFDDLQTEGRVTYVDDIRQSLRDEMPYLLFYQVMPMVDAAAPSTEGGDTEPPSYRDSRPSLEFPPNPSLNDVSSLATSGHDDSYFESTPTVSTFPSSRSRPPSIRFSLDFDRPTAEGSEAAGSSSRLRSSLGDPKRVSMSQTDSNVGSPAISPALTPEAHSPAITPSDESTAARLSRAASRFAKGRYSRPSSQSGEKRLSMSMTMGRLGGVMKAGRDASVDSVVDHTSANVPTVETVEIDASGASSEGGDPAYLQTHATLHKHSHRRSKSKEKSGKSTNKADAQPDRECTVM